MISNSSKSKPTERSKSPPPNKRPIDGGSKGGGNGSPFTGTSQREGSFFGGSSQGAGGRNGSGRGGSGGRCGGRSCEGFGGSGGRSPGEGGCGRKAQPL